MSGAPFKRSRRAPRLKGAREIRERVARVERSETRVLRAETDPGFRSAQSGLRMLPTARCDRECACTPGALVHRAPAAGRGLSVDRILATDHDVCTSFTRKSKS